MARQGRAWRRADLFPRFITADQLVGLMERTREPKQTAGGFEWVSQQIVDAIEPLSEPAVALCDKLADLLWRGRLRETKIYNLHSRFDYLAPALAMLCDRQMVATGDRSNANLVRAAVIACRFSDLRGVNRGNAALRARVAANAMLRKDAFWAELTFVDEVSPTDDAWRRFCNVVEDSSGGLASHPTDADRSWLLEALADKGKPDRRAVALHALIDLWRRNGRAMRTWTPFVQT